MCVPQGKKTVTDEEIIEAMASSDDPAFVTAELAENFNMTNEGMRLRLEELHETGKIYRKKPNKRTVIWWLEPGYCDDSLK